MILALPVRAQDVEVVQRRCELVAERDRPVPTRVNIEQIQANTNEELPELARDICLHTPTTIGSAGLDVADLIRRC